jgi:hypothetical protein
MNQVPDFRRIMQSSHFWISTSRRWRHIESLFSLFTGKSNGQRFRSGFRCGCGGNSSYAKCNESPDDLLVTGVVGQHFRREAVVILCIQFGSVFD